MVLVFFASLLPGLFWLWYFNRYDAGDKEPPAKLALCMLAGAVAVIPALSWESLFAQWLQAPNSFAVQLSLSFLVVGLGEELFKFLAVYVAIAKSPEFNEPIDGIIYSIATGIGFSVVENVLYISSFGLVIAPLRGTVATLAHIAFSGFAGYFLGKAKFSHNPMPLLLAGLLVAATAHGLYDLLLITQLLSPLSVLLLVALLQFLLFAAIRAAVKIRLNR